MHSQRDLPPTPLDIVPTPDKVQRLHGEVLALRLLLATAVWKAGGTVSITSEEIAFVGTSCKLDADPVEGGQILSISYPTPAEALVLPHGVKDA
jgi:hypothetical protein